MPDLQEVFRMSTQKVKPDPGALERQHDHRRKQERKRKIGAFAVVAAIGAVVAVLVVRSAPNERQLQPAGTGPSVTVPDALEVDYVIDLNTGVTTRLPKAIIRSAARSRAGSLRLGPRYAASPDGSQLAYVGTGDEKSLQIFIAGSDGTGVRQVTHDPRGATYPAWSPDGTMIAYEGHGSGGVRSLFVLVVATGESTPIADTGRLRAWAQPQFTPDGSSLLYTTGSNCSMLRTVPIDGGKSTVLIGPDEGMGCAGTGSLSPDGSLVTMVGNEIGGPGPGRFVANADGTELRSIPGLDSNPAGTWSPDGRRIVCSDYGGKDILVVDIATGHASRVAEGSGAIWLDDHTLLVER